jgi:two-component system nitrogen regulation response regulator GlnG
MAPAQTISVQDLPPEVLEAPAASAEPLSTLPAQEPLAQPLPVEAAPALVAGSPAPAPQPAAVLHHGLHTAEAVPQADGVAVSNAWEQALEREAQGLLAAGHNDIWDALAHRFESRLIRTALAATHGRRMEAAQRLGIGRNTITRKIQELGLDGEDEAKNASSA